MTRFRWNANGKVYDRPDDLLEFPTGHLRHLKKVSGSPIDPADLVEAGVSLYWLSIWQTDPQAAPSWESTSEWRLGADFEDLPEVAEGDAGDPTDPAGPGDPQE